MTHTFAAQATRRIVNTRRSFGLDALFGLWRQRNRLAQLDDAALRDIGLTREQARAEAARPVWDVPATWRA